MSSQPHIVLPRIVRRTRLPLLCTYCRSRSATTGEGRFRANANSRLLDVWLLARCTSCDRTSKLTNHPGLVASKLLDPLLARHNHFTLDWNQAWRLDTPTAWPDQAWPVQVKITFADPVPIRPDRLIAHGLGLSRNETLRRIKSDIPVRHPTSSGFTLNLRRARRFSGGRLRWGRRC